MADPKDGADPMARWADDSRFIGARNSPRSENVTS
jgi:hypothetical protein